MVLEASSGLRSKEENLGMTTRKWPQGEEGTLVMPFKYSSYNWLDGFLFQKQCDIVTMDTKFVATLGSNLNPLLSCFVTLCKLLKFSEPQFIHL